MSDTASLNGSAVHDAPHNDTCTTLEIPPMAQRATPTDLPQPVPTTERTKGWKTAVVQQLRATRPRSTATELKRLFDAIYPDDNVSLSVVVHALKAKGKGGKPRTVKPAVEPATESNGTKPQVTTVTVVAASTATEPTIGELRQVWQYIRERGWKATDVAGLFTLASAEAVASAVRMVVDMQEAGQQ